MPYQCRVVKVIKLVHLFTIFEKADCLVLKKKKTELEGSLSVLVWTRRGYVSTPYDLWVILVSVHSGRVRRRSFVPTPKWSWWDASWT